MTHSITHRLLHEPRWTKWFLFALTVVLYVNSFNHSFNLDDQLVTDGHRFTSKGLSAIVEIIRSPYYQDDLGYSYDYRPVTHISFAIQHQLFGQGARAGHVINVLLYALSVLLVFSLSRRLLNGKSPWGPLAVATLFAVHPMHTEVVCSLKNRDEMLSMLFSLLALKRILARPVGIVNVLSSAPLMLLALLSKLSVAPLLLLAPMLGGIVGLDRRLIIFIGTLVALVFLPVLIIRDWPLWWVAAIVAVMSAMHGLSHVARHPKALISFFKKWLSPSVPRASLSWSPATDAKTALAHLITVLPLVAFALSDDTTYLLFSAVLAICLPYWTGKRSGLLLVIALIAITVYQSHSIHHSLFVMMAVYALFSLRAAGVDRRKQLIAVSMVAAAHFLSTFYSLGNVGAGLLTVVSYMPLQLYLSTERKRESVIFLLLLSAATLVAIVIERDVDSAVILMGLLAMLLFIRPKEGFLVSAKVETALPMSLLILAVVSGLVVNGHTENWLAPAAVTTETVTAPVGTREVATAIEDRPLTLVEFPLDAYKEQDVHIGTASAILGHYLKMMFVPWPQAFYYGFDEVPLVRMSDPRAIASVVIHSLLLLIALALMRAHPVVSFGIIAYVASIALFSNLVSPVAGMIGDRLTYVASFGFCVAVGSGLGMLMDKLQSARSRRTLGGVIGSVLIVFAGTTIARSALWKDPLTLMRNDIRTVPNSSQAHYLLGYNLMMESFGVPDQRKARELHLEAITHLKQAASIFPDYLNYWHDLGKAYRDLGDLKSALPCFKEAHRLDTTFYEATIHVAMISEELGNRLQAIAFYEKCMRLNPNQLQSYTNLSFLYFKSSEFEASIEVNKMAIAANPSWRDPYINIAQTYEQLGQPEKAREYRDMLGGGR